MDAYAQEWDKDEWGYAIGEFLLNVHNIPSSYGYNDWGANPWDPRPVIATKRPLREILYSASDDAGISVKTDGWG